MEKVIQICALVTEMQPSLEHLSVHQSVLVMKYYRFCWDESRHKSRSISQKSHRILEVFLSLGGKLENNLNF